MLQSLVQGLKSLVLGRGSALTPEERRNLIRVRCRLPVVVKEPNQANQATVTDISLNGLRVKLTARPRGQELLVSPAEHSLEYEIDTVRCLVIWTRKRRFTGDIVAGLKFHEAPDRMAKSWVRFALRAIGLDERAIYQRRKYIRAEATLPADIYQLQTGERFGDGRAVNLGMGGALVQTLDDLCINSEVRVHLGPSYGFRTLNLPGVVLGGQHDEDRKHFLYSIRFIHPDEDQGELLGKYVIALLKESSGLYGR